MREINLEEAEPSLSHLVDAAVAGENVVLARAGVPLVRLTPVLRAPARRSLGIDQGKIWIADDFDAPMPELEALFYGDSSDEDPSCC